MTNFHEMIVDSFVWTSNVDTIESDRDGRIYCNRDWWMSLNEYTKIKFIEHEIKHIARKK